MRCLVMYITGVCLIHVFLDFENRTCCQKYSKNNYSGYQSHAPYNDFLPFQKLSGVRQSNVSMTIVVFISCQFHGDVRSSLDHSLQNRRDFLRISGEQGRKQGEREARVACVGRFAKKSRLSPYHCSSCSGVIMRPC